MYLASTTNMQLSVGQMLFPEQLHADVREVSDAMQFIT
jgi:hypothetical protein